MFYDKCTHAAVTNQPLNKYGQRVVVRCFLGEGFGEGWACPPLRKEVMGLGKQGRTPIFGNFWFS